MSALRGLAERTYAVATTRPTSNVGIDAIEDAIQAAVNDHTRALADALEAARQKLCEARCMRHEVLSTSHIPECDEARFVLRRAGRLPAAVPCVCDNGVFRDCPVHYPEG